LIIISFINDLRAGRRLWVRCLLSWNKRTAFRFSIPFNRSWKFSLRSFIAKTNAIW